jgi:hypothetical protein
MWYIGTKQHCIDYDNQVKISEKYFKGDNWCTPTKHPTKELYSIMAHDSYPSTMDKVKELGNDWNTTI